MPETLKEQGIHAILNLCTACYDLREIEQKGGFPVYFPPASNRDEHGKDDLERVLAWLDENPVSDQKVLEHYRFRIRRTGILW